MSKSAPATEFLGIRLVFTPTELNLDQEEYIDKILKRFNMSSCKPCSTPLESKCTSADFANSELFEGPFRELIGSLLYLAVTTRPDILFFSELSQPPSGETYCCCLDWTQKDLKPNSPWEAPKGEWLAIVSLWEQGQHLDSPSVMLEVNNGHDQLYRGRE
ncbi:hypothetical protein AVEN_157310-1 [Araneus ventricosus]|uniref:Reverse transcriptase Ty1/copia-type domain-containing protein n=1 Tax=Araneus ventricosus TaxID=182803 RepID=A0A4Y2ULX3_ARAVE|nr:hypothetical protein AVEN_31269-1 [Araneus ventricosus]GBO14055.1 hypothetical protein AVEN_157310-1 [Araneus ventricosus]